MPSRLGMRMGIYYENNSAHQRLHWYLLAGGKSNYSRSFFRDFYPGRTNTKHDCYAENDVLFLEAKIVNLFNWSYCRGCVMFSDSINDRKRISDMEGTRKRTAVVFIYIYIYIYIYHR